MVQDNVRTPSKAFVPDITRFGRVRLWLRSFRGYVLWCCFIEGTCVSYVALKRNYLLRYSFMKKDDMLINPYWTATDYRKKGLTSYFLSHVIEKPDQSWKNLYAVVAKNNIGSIRCLKSVGFRLVGFAKKGWWTYKIVENNTGLIVYRYAKEGKNEHSI